MIEFLAEYVIKDQARGQFELVYGPGGAWSKLFGRSSGFRGTTLLRDLERPQRYVTVEFWDTLAHREQMIAAQPDEYASLLSALHGWTDSYTQLGVFRALAEATVQPRARSRRGLADRRRGR